MEGHVLVLNQDFSPMTICSVKKAFLLVYLNKADLVFAPGNKTIRTVDKSFPLPSIIKINQYISIPFKGLVLTRQNVFRRDNYECQYCGSKKDLTLDHLIPRSKGGKSSWKNLVTACKRCNAKKGDFKPEEVGLKLKRAPHRPSYFLFMANNFGKMDNEWERFLVHEKASS